MGTFMTINLQPAFRMTQKPSFHNLIVLLLIVHGLWISLPLHAQVYRISDDYPGPSSGVLEAQAGEDLIYYIRRTESIFNHPAYIKKGESTGALCAVPNDDPNVYEILTVIENELICSNDSGQLLGLNAHTNSSKILYTLDSSKRQVLYTSLKNEKNDLIVLFIEYTNIENSPYYYDSLAVYVKPALEDTLYRRGTLQTNISFTDISAESFEMASTYTHLFLKLNSLWPFQNIECFDLATGSSRILNEEAEIAAVRIEFEQMDSLVYFFDGVELYATNGTFGELNKIQLPYNGVSVFSIIEERLSICEHYLLFKGVHNNQVVLFAYDTKQKEFILLGEMPWNTIDAQFEWWNNELVCFLRTYDYGYKVLVYDMQGNHRVVEEYTDIIGYYTLQLFSNNEKVFWSIGSELNALYSSRLEPLSTTWIETPVLNYTEAQTFIPYDQGFYAVARTQEFGREFMQYKNDMPVVDFEINSLITAYPNPCMDELVVNFGSYMKEMRLMLLDSRGALHFSDTYYNAHSATLNTQQLEKGMYYVQLIGPNTTKTVKIIKS